MGIMLMIYGCRLPGKFVGALAYADDITLLCPSLHGLQEMVNICADFGTDYHVTFNLRIIKFKKST